MNLIPFIENIIQNHLLPLITLWVAVGGLHFLYAFFGRMFGFYHPAVSRYFQILPWRPVWKAWTAFCVWKERVFTMGKAATAKWTGILSVLCMIYRTGQLPIGRPLFLGMPLPHTTGLTLNRHAVMIAGTGGGKTTFMQTVLGLHQGSAFVIDPKLQMQQTMGVARSRFGKVFTLAPFNPDQSHCYNIFDEIDAAIKRFGKDTAPRFFLKLASTLIIPDGDKAYFTDTARDIVAAIIAYVYLNEPEERRNLVTVREYLMEGLCPEDFENPNDAFLFLLSEMQRSNAYNGFISKRAISLSNTGQETAGNVLSTARTQTQWLDLPEVQNIICDSDFLLADLKSDKNPVTVFVGAPVTAVKGELSRWFRMLVEMELYLFETIPGNLKNPCLFVLDEFPSLGHIQSVETAAPLLRSFGVRLFCITQDTERLMDVYPRSWEGFLGNADAVFWMGTNHHSTAEYLTKTLGTTTIKEKISSGLFSKEPKRFQLRERPLCYSDQIKRFLDPDSSNMIVTRFGKRPLKVKQIPYYKEIPVWLYEPDPNFVESPPRAWFRKTIQPFLTNNQRR